MPVRLGDYIQSVLLKGRLYVVGNETSGVILSYTFSLGKWAKLLQYKACDFSMTALNQQLVLVGDSGADFSRVLGVWEEDMKCWIHPYPEMLTGRCACSAIGYNEWLVVAGGFNGGRSLSTVEVLNTYTLQWHTGPPTPMPWYDMKTAIVGDTCYFMGGNINASPTTAVFSASIQALTSDVITRANSGQQAWKEVPELCLTGVTPLSIGVSLFAVGGLSGKQIQPVTAIHVYHPVSGEWERIGDLPSPRYNCTCAMLPTSCEIMVVGGNCHDRRKMNRVDFASTLN